jgi:hypothetical protein
MRTFEAFGRKLEYFAGLGERTIEVPMAIEALKAFNPLKTIEVGAVMPYNLTAFPDGKVHHRVIDKFDPTCEQIDGCDFDYHGWDVLSVSTLEHFDVGDHGNTEINGIKGPECLEKIIKESSRYFITIPLGYNKPMDRYVQHSGHRCWLFKQAAGPTNAIPDTKPVWIEAKNPSQVDWETEYASPFHYANAVVVLTNIPWIMEGTGWMSQCFDNGLAAAEALQSKLTEVVLAIESQTGPMTRHLLNNLIASFATPVVYLEIGLRYGGSFISALYENQVKQAYGIDLPVIENVVGIRETMLANLNRFITPASPAWNRITLHFEGCWTFEPHRLRTPVNIYLFDGPHTEEDHRMALVHYAQCLDRNFIYLVDDWNWDATRNGTEKGLKETGFEVVHSQSRFGSDNMADRFFNGLWVAHLRKP